MGFFKKAGEMALSLVAEVFTSFVGHEIGERVNVGGGGGATRTATARVSVGEAGTIAHAIGEQIADRIKKKLEPVDRIKFGEVVSYLVDQNAVTGRVPAILLLLKAANEQGGLCDSPSGRDYLEHDLVRWLVEIATRRGKPNILWLNSLLEKDSDAFFAQYEIWNNDPVAQNLRLVWKRVKPHARATLNFLYTFADSLERQSRGWKGVDR